MIRAGKKRKTFRLPPELIIKIPQLRKGINCLVKIPHKKRELKSENRIRCTVSLPLTLEQEILELAGLYKVSQNDVVIMALLLI